MPGRSAATPAGVVERSSQSSTSCASMESAMSGHDIPCSLQPEAASRPGPPPGAPPPPPLPPTGAAPRTSGSFSRAVASAPLPRALSMLKQPSGLLQLYRNSSLAKTSCGLGDECRICLQGEEAGELVHPCECSGTMHKAHLSCLSTWAKEKRSLCCELCKAQYCEPYYSRLKVEVDRAVREHEEQRASTYVTILQEAGATADGYRGRGSLDDLDPGSMHNIMCQVVVVLVLLGVVLYLTVFSNIAPSLSNDWTSVLWRVLTILIPGYLIGRLLIGMVSRWAAARRERRAQALRAAQVESALIERVLRESAAEAAAALAATIQAQPQQEQQDAAASSNGATLPAAPLLQQQQPHQQAGGARHSPGSAEHGSAAGGQGGSSQPAQGNGSPASGQPQQVRQQGRGVQALPTQPVGNSMLQAAVAASSAGGSTAAVAPATSLAQHVVVIRAAA